MGADTAGGWGVAKTRENEWWMGRTHEFFSLCGLGAMRLTNELHGREGITHGKHEGTEREQHIFTFSGVIRDKGALCT